MLNRIFITVLIAVFFTGIVYAFQNEDPKPVKETVEIPKYPRHSKWRLDHWTGQSYEETGYWYARRYYAGDWVSFQCVPGGTVCWLWDWVTGWDMYDPAPELGPPTEIGPTSESEFFDHCPELNSDGLYQ